MYPTNWIGHRVLHRLQQHNPFYFISAACMLGGILAVTNSLSWVSIPVSRLLVLIATLNIYEAMLIALAFYLVRVRGLLRDGIMLLVLEALFLIDITFLNAEIVTSHLALGLAINGVLFLVTIVKLGVIAALLGQKRMDARFIAVVIQVAALFALPAVFRWLDRGDLSSHVFYAAWWIVGLLIPLSQFICRKSAPVHAAAWARNVFALYLALPWLSLILHVAILHYVYDVHLYGADMAPVLLGLAFIFNGVETVSTEARFNLLVVRTLFPMAAILVSLNNPTPLCFGNAALWVTPFDLSLAATYLTYVYFFASAHAVYFLAAGACAVMTWIFGPTMGQVEEFFSTLWDWACELAWSWTPKTAIDWGITAIAAAFAFLGIGAAISLGPRRMPVTLPTEEPDQSGP